MTSTGPAQARPTADSSTRTAFLIVDTESVPDGDLIAHVKYPDDNLTADEAIERARSEARDLSPTGSDFLPVTFQVPVAVCAIRVAADFRLQKLSCLDAPQYRQNEIIKKFWMGLDFYKAKLVTFNGRGFDVPLMELAAFRQGINIGEHIRKSRNRYNGGLDLLEFFTNFGACRLAGGLNLLAKMIGLPGKMDVSGDQVLEMYRRGDLRAINDYCLCDTLDTYFIFLRTRVMTGEIDSEEEQKLLALTRENLEGQLEEFPVLRHYLDQWK
jgi:predicted PolB exonuclease-like 3'-5' exonuclease